MDQSAVYIWFPISYPYSSNLGPIFYRFRDNQRK